MFLVLINMSTFRFSLFKKFLQFLVPKSFPSSLFAPLQSKLICSIHILFWIKFYNYYKNLSKKKYLTKHELNINFFFTVKNLYLIYALLKNSNFFYNTLHNFIKKIKTKSNKFFYNTLHNFMKEIQKIT